MNRNKLIFFASILALLVFAAYAQGTITPDLSNLAAPFQQAYDKLKSDGINVNFIPATVSVDFSKVQQDAQNVVNNVVNSLVPRLEKITGTSLGVAASTTTKPPAKGGSSTGSAQLPGYAKWIGYILIILFVFLAYRAFVTKKSIFDIKGLFGWVKEVSGLRTSDSVKKINEAGQKEKEELERLEKVFKEKEALILENEKRFRALAEFLNLNSDKKDYAKIWDEKLEEDERKWSAEIVSKIKKANSIIGESLKRYESFLKTFEKGFLKKYNDAQKNDLAAITRLERDRLIGPPVIGQIGGNPVIDAKSNSVQNLLRELEDIRKILSKEADLINKEFYPEINDLANAVRVMRTTILLEEKLIDTEYWILRDLGKGSLHGKKIEETIELLKTSAEQKSVKFREEQIMLDKIKKAEEKLGGVKAEISDEQLNALKKKEVTTEILEDPKKNMYRPADSPLILKDVEGTPTGEEIHSIGELKMRLPRSPMPLTHPAMSMNDVILFNMVKKQRSGKSDLYRWILQDCHYPELADKIEKLIEEKELPAEIEFEHKPDYEKQAVKTFPKEYQELVRDLIDLRKRVLEVIDDAYPPISI